MHRHIMAPSWVKPGAKYDFDFASGRYFGAHLEKATANGPQSAKSLGTGSNNGASSGSYFLPDTNGLYVANSAQYEPPLTGYGLWAVGKGTDFNYALWCRDMTNAAWTKTAITTAKTSVGADGKANSATRMTATNATNSALQGITLASTQVTVSALIKRVTGTGDVALTCDNGTTWTDISSHLNSSTFTLVQAPAQTLANPTVGIKFSTNGDAVDVDFFQLENNPAATAPILTTTVALGRGPMITYLNSSAVLSGVSANNGYHFLHDVNHGTPMSLVIEYSGNFHPTLKHLIYGDDVSNVFITGDIGGGTVSVTAQGGVFTSADSEVAGLYTVNKLAVRFGGDGSAICLNGGNITTSSSVTYRQNDIGLTHGAWGNNGAGILPMNGFVKRVSYWRGLLTDGQMKGFTS